VTIIPRWEWRTFGADFAAGPLGSVQRVAESEEVYLLSPDTDASVKIRDGKLDTASFTHLRVHKHRAHYTVGGCMAELTTLRTEQGTIQTLAVESEEPERVRAAVRSLGLADRANTCMARGLKAFAGIGARRFAVIDIGTNSVKFHVGERDAAGSWRTLVDRAEVTRLGEGLDRTGALSEAAIERTAAAVNAMVEEAGAEQIAAVGTAALRSAGNAGAFIRRVHVPVELISGEEEARLAYLGATAELAQGHGTSLVFDSGGGSLQFTFGHGGRVDERFSVNVGAVRMTERFGLAGVVTDEALAAALDGIAGELPALAGRPAPDAVVGMGGTVTNLAAVAHGMTAYDPDVIQGSRLERAEIDRQIELYRTRDAAGRREIPGLQPNRAEVILAGACIVRTVLATLAADALTVSDRGLRHGLLTERFGGQALRLP
jgi:exopolyphosphatase / guanosine-5'-triphosphate,3'-diphosphate pyrophosphatase